MKKSKILMPFAALTALFGVVAPIATLASCAKKEVDPVSKCTVTFNYRDLTTESKVVEVNKGETVTKPEDPTIEGCKFLGWFTDMECKNQYDFSSKVTTHLVLYAGWEVTAEIASVILDELPTKLTYKQGQALDLTGLKVSVKLTTDTIVEIPAGFYTTNPVAGTILNDLGSKSISVKVGDKTNSFTVTVVKGVTAIAVTSDVDFNNIIVGDKIYRKDFTVGASFTDGTSALVNDWTCNLFEDGATEYTFNEVGNKLITINYQGHQWTTMAVVNSTGEFTFTMPNEISLPMSTHTEKGFTSSKKITILDNGQPATTADFKFEVVKGAENISVTDGVITTIKATVASDPAEIKVTNSQGTAIGENIKVHVVNEGDPDVTYHLAIRGFADYSVFTKVNNNCVIPDYITHNLKDYDLRITGTSYLNDVLNLYLPYGYYTIWDIPASVGTKIQNVYFDGTTAEWKNKQDTFFWTWSNQFVTGIQCNDGFVAKNAYSAKAEIQWITQGGNTFLAYATPKFTNWQGKAILQFDFTEFGDAIDNLTDINFVNENWTQDFKVYTNGEELTKTTDYTFADHKLTLTPAGKTKCKGKNVVISSDEMVNAKFFAYTTLNVVERMVVYPRRSYKVGQYFNYAGINPYYVLTDGKGVKVDISDIKVEWVKKSGGTQTELANNHLFNAGEVGVYTVTVTSRTYSTISQTYELTITE